MPETEKQVAETVTAEPVNVNGERKA